MASSNAIQSETIINSTDIKKTSSDSTFTLQFYGKFRVQAPKIENVIRQLECRVTYSDTDTKIKDDIFRTGDTSKATVGGNSTEENVSSKEI